MNRRSFLKGLAAAGVAVALSPALPMRMLEEQPAAAASAVVPVAASGLEYLSTWVVVAPNTVTDAEATAHHIHDMLGRMLLEDAGR